MLSMCLLAEQTLFKVATGYVYEQERFISTKEGLIKIVEQKISHPNPAMLRMFLEVNKPERYVPKTWDDIAKEKEAEHDEALKEIWRRNRESENYKISIKYKPAG